jgi:NAD(P)-dependent dehydrogenase (short-subunit alcohol dehydrogenase family)
MSVVLITGCSSGIGLETALAFARRGDTVAASMRNPAGGDELHRRAKDEGLDIDVVTLDVTDDESVTSAVRDVETRIGPIDVLVNNAGVGYSGPIETIDLDRARAVMETNYWGPVRTIRAVLPSMRVRVSGVIINVSSTAGRVPGTGFNAFYGSSKHALGALTEALAMEVGAFGIRAVCIEPGFFATDIFSKSRWADVDDSTPYADDDRWINTFYVTSGEAIGGDPASVATAIVSAVDDEHTPTHVLVGDDAHQFVGLVEGAGTFEAWLPIATQIVEGVVGPRPVVPRYPITSTGRAT